MILLCALIFWGLNLYLKIKRYYVFDASMNGALGDFAALTMLLTLVSAVCKILYYILYVLCVIVWWDKGTWLTYLLILGFIVLGDISTLLVDYRITDRIAESHPKLKWVRHLTFTNICNFVCLIALLLSSLNSLGLTIPFLQKFESGLVHSIALTYIGYITLIKDFREKE